MRDLEQVHEPVLEVVATRSQDRVVVLSLNCDVEKLACIPIMLQSIVIRF